MILSCGNNKISWGWEMPRICFINLSERLMSLGIMGGGGEVSIIMRVATIGWNLNHSFSNNEKFYRRKTQHLRTKFEMRLLDNERWYQTKTKSERVTFREPDLKHSSWNEKHTWDEKIIEIRGSKIRGTGGKFRGSPLTHVLRYQNTVYWWRHNVGR